MKTLTVTEAKSDFEAMLKAAQKERIVVMRGSRPSAVLVGVESYDEDDLRLATSAEFWEMIEARRKKPPFHWADLKAKLRVEPIAKAKAQTVTRKSTRTTKRTRRRG